MPNGIAKLTIKAYKDAAFSEDPEQEVPQVVVQINPSKYTQTDRICYTDKKAMGSPGASPVFNKMESQTLTFELVFDGTGALPTPIGVLPTYGVADQVKAFKAVAYAYNGKSHQPNYLKLIWGEFLFKCRLQSLSLDYTLFAPDGRPLRARATTTFVGFTDEEILQAEVKPNSPDLSHVVTVQTGDTLPLLCHRIYGRSRYYSQVAAVNGLTGFRDLRPGTQLVFPPLSGSA